MCHCQTVTSHTHTHTHVRVHASLTHTFIHPCCPVLFLIYSSTEMSSVSVSAVFSTQKIRISYTWLNRHTHSFCHLNSANTHLFILICCFSSTEKKLQIKPRLWVDRGQQHWRWKTLCSLWFFLTGVLYMCLFLSISLLRAWKFYLLYHYLCFTSLWVFTTQIFSSGFVHFKKTNKISALAISCFTDSFWHVKSVLWECL